MEKLLKKNEINSSKLKTVYAGTLYPNQKIELLLNKSAVINQKPFHSADVDSTCADITKAKNILDWEPIITFDKRLEKTVSLYMKNKSWLKDIKFI